MGGVERGKWGEEKREMKKKWVESCVLAKKFGEIRGDINNNDVQPRPPTSGSQKKKGSLFRMLELEICRTFEFQTPTDLPLGTGSLSPLINKHDVFTSLFGHKPPLPLGPT